jgi:hypothetical protein
MRSDLVLQQSAQLFCQAMGPVSRAFGDWFGANCYPSRTGYAVMNHHGAALPRRRTFNALDLKPRISQQFLALQNVAY